MDLKDRSQGYKVYEVLNTYYKKSLCLYIWGWAAVAQSVERATPGEDVQDSIPSVAARSLLIGSVSI